MILVLKLILTPLLIGGATLAGRRWGPTVSGWLVGLPLTSGPVSFFLALEYGPAFAAHAVLGTLMGLISVVTYCVVYAWLSLRINWPGCWLGSWAAFFATTWLFEQFSLPLLVTFGGVMLAICAALASLPAHQGHVSGGAPPAWDLGGRMVVATVFVLLLTGVAALLGPHLSGLLSPLPIFATIVTAFTHRFTSATAARQTLHGVLIGLFACAVFFLIVATLMVTWGLVLAFVLAIAGTLCVQGFSLWVMQHARG